MASAQIVLADFETVRPRYEKSQAYLAAWLARAHAAAEARASGSEVVDPRCVSRMAALIGRFGCGPGLIGSRGTEMPDVLSEDPTRPGIYGVLASGARPQGAGILERSAFFSEVSTGVFERFYPPGSSPPEHLIHVTCTGYVSPSPAQRLVAARGWSGDCEITHAYHMGCYAAIPALRMARGFVASGQTAVDVVHTEICTLHLNPLDHAPEQWVVQSLFADGHVKFSVRPREASPGLDVLRTAEWIVPGSADAMTWTPSESGMRMTLARDVPERIAAAIEPFVARLLDEAGMGGVQAAAELGFAIHPGGPRIIDSLASRLGLSERQISHSRGVLRDFGNMSSATLPHIWKRLLEDPDVPEGRVILSLAFGPGLTIFGALLRKRGLAA